MTQTGAIAVAVTLMVSVTLAIGAIGLRISRTTGDFYVASRMISPRANASAVSGEYLSAASFLGVAGLILAGGVHMLWFPIGYTAGYLALLCLVAAPLRRSGAYTLPDFAEWRLESARIRKVSALLVVGIGWLYLLPQLQGAGLALRSVIGTPAYVGSLVVAAVVLLNVLAGGMRSITLVQVFQYWVKLTAISIPVVLLMAAWAASRDHPSLDDSDVPRAPQAVVVQTSENLVLSTTEPTTVTVHGSIAGAAVHGEIALMPGVGLRVDEGTSLSVAAGQVIPHARTAGASTVLDPTQGHGREALYRTYSLLLALTFGTMGLPHVLVRFYTNPDGRDARRTAASVIGLLGLFYAFPPFYGALGRVYAADLLMTGRADAVVLELPRRLIGEPWAQILVAILVAGALAAFLATSSGIVVSVAGVISQDLLGDEVYRSRTGRPRNGVATFRLAAIAGVAIPLALSLISAPTSLAGTISLVFAVAASTFSPLLLLGVWWRGLTQQGALAGMIVGSTCSVGSLLATVLQLPTPPLLAVALAQPAAWTIPLAFAVTVLVSRRGHPPANHVQAMARLHSPERPIRHWTMDPHSPRSSQARDH